MTGSHTVRLSKLLLAALTAAAVAAAAPAPAFAHERDDAFEQRRHVRSRARSKIGAGYGYGATGPRRFDCSGFTMWVFKKHGARLPHSSIKQFELGKKYGYKRIWKRKKLKVGDLVFHKTTSAKVGHAGIYIGKGKFISATSSGGVRVRSLYDRYYWGARWVAGTRTPTTIND